MAFLLGIVLFLGLNAIITLKQIFIETHTTFWNVWYLPINSIAIMLSLPVLSQMKTAPKIILKPITYLSIISYAMYILHYSIILQLLKHYLPSDELPGFDVIVFIIVYISLTIFLSYFIYRFFEKPFTNLRDSQRIKTYFK